MNNQTLEMQKCIVVLGMHRSGTSAITRGLKVFGVELGDNLMPPFANNNEKGFWEDIEINALDNEMLSALGSDWHYLAPVQPSDIQVLHQKGYFIKTVELLRQKIGTFPVFGFKDPQLAKLLPFWKDVFLKCQLYVCYVLAIRHPLSVVQSLTARDNFDPQKSYLMWLGHVFESLSGMAGEKCIVVDYDHLMQSPDFELNRIAKQLDLEIDSAELQIYKSAFLDQKLRHTGYKLNDLFADTACPQLVREIYSALLDVASDKKRIDDSSLQKKIDIWAGEYERLKLPLSLLDKLTKAICERDEQIAALYNSTSWKITKPLRFAGDKIKNCGKRQ